MMAEGFEIAECAVLLQQLSARSRLIVVIKH